MLTPGMGGVALNSMMPPMGQQAQLYSWARDVSAVQIQTNDLYQTLGRQGQFLIGAASQSNQPGAALRGDPRRFR